MTNEAINKKLNPSYEELAEKLSKAQSENLKLRDANIKFSNSNEDLKKEMQSVIDKSVTNEKLKEYIGCLERNVDYCTKDIKDLKKQISQERQLRKKYKDQIQIIKELIKESPN